MCLELPITNVPCKSVFSTAVCLPLPPPHVTIYLPATVSHALIFFAVFELRRLYISRTGRWMQSSPSVSAFALLRILNTFFGVRAGQSDGMFKNMSAIWTPYLVFHFQQDTSNTPYLFTNLLCRSLRGSASGHSFWGGVRENRLLWNPPCQKCWGTLPSTVVYMMERPSAHP